MPTKNGLYKKVQTKVLWSHKPTNNAGKQRRKRKDKDNGENYDWMNSQIWLVDDRNVSLLAYNE